jgi:hypothetical protein
LRLAPQTTKRFDVVIPHEWTIPAAISLKSPSKITGEGSLLQIKLSTPHPQAPYVLLPQLYTLLFSKSARLWPFPAAIYLTNRPAGRFSTSFGLRRIPVFSTSPFLLNLKYRPH